MQCRTMTNLLSLSLIQSCISPKVYFQDFFLTNFDGLEGIGLALRAIYGTNLIMWTVVARVKFVIKFNSLDIAVQEYARVNTFYADDS